MEIITVTKENLNTEHICCAISNNNDPQVMAKKSWLAQRFDDGLIFKKGNVRGKCFIEYIPAEKAWAPVTAEGYMYIDCLWVSGQFKGQGNGGLLLDECIRDSREKGKKGLVTLSAGKKMPFLSDPKFLQHKGFSVADTAGPYTLLYLPFDQSAPCPQFKACIKSPVVNVPGFMLFYSHQCPFTAKYVPLVEAHAKEKGIPWKSICFESAEEAQNAPAPFTTYSLFYNGALLTHEILSVNRLEKIIGELGI